MHSRITSCVGRVSASVPASGATYFSTYILIVAPDEPVPAWCHVTDCVRYVTFASVKVMPFTVISVPQQI